MLAAFGNPIRACDESQIRNADLEGRTAWKLKLVLERLAALVILLLLSPVFLAIATLIVLDTGLPVFYSRERIGQGGRPFMMHKFRTMIRDAETMEGGLSLSAQDERITRVGHRLRAFSLDELPQLMNMVKGEMSLVGPRPMLPDQFERCDARQRRRLEVRPGLTGWSQTHGRNLLSWEARIQQDIWYIDHWTPLLDARILARTPIVVLTGEGLYGADGHNPDMGD